MNDIIKRSLVSLLGVALLVYMIYLFSTGAVIVHGAIADYNYAWYAIIMLAAGFFTAVYGIYPIEMKMQKVTLGALGVFMIFVAHNYLVNDPDTYIYVEDFVKIFGVVLILFGATGVLITKKVKKKKEDSKIEVIEV